MIHRSNGFDGLRLVAASMVIFGHAFALTGQAAIPAFLGSGIHAIGVKTFFVISGYLITRSWQSDPNLLHFWIKRLLRVMPGLIAVCLVTIFVLGPLTTVLPLSDYFRNSQTFGYLWNIALHPQYELPGVFEENVFPRAVNGSLWTLPVEIAMYCGVPLFVGLYRPAARFVVPAVACLLLAGSIYFLRIAPPTDLISFWGMNWIPTLDIDYYFYAGASIAVLRLDRFGNPLIAVALLVASNWIFSGPVPNELALAVTLPYLVISLGKTKSALLRRLEGNDFSYGVYLYGFPVQQTVVHFVGAQSALFNVAVSLSIAAVLGVISWFVVEKRALAFKPDRNDVKHAFNSRKVEALDLK
jgi:peptidoglycan/LPS O-acetylase OafA/YrhL